MRHHSRALTRQKQGQRCRIGGTIGAVRDAYSAGSELGTVGRQASWLLVYRGRYGHARRDILPE